MEKDWIQRSWFSLLSKVFEIQVTIASPGKWAQVEEAEIWREVGLSGRDLWREEEGVRSKIFHLRLFLPCSVLKALYCFPPTFQTVSSCNACVWVMFSGRKKKGGVSWGGSKEGRGRISLHRGSWEGVTENPGEGVWVRRQVTPTSHSHMHTVDYRMCWILHIMRDGNSRHFKGSRPRETWRT